MSTPESAGKDALLADLRDLLDQYDADPRGVLVPFRLRDLIRKHDTPLTPADGGTS